MSWTLKNIQANYDALLGEVGFDKAKNILPDIIMCDIMMPELDGYGVIDALSKNTETKHIPFIFLSAKTERQDVRKGMNLGADDYITKPFSEDDLISAIESRLAKSAILKDERERLKNNTNTDININNTSIKIKGFSDIKLDNNEITNSNLISEFYGFYFSPKLNPRFPF